MGRIKLAAAALVTLVCLGLAACGASTTGSGNQPSSSASSSHPAGWG